MKRFAIALLLSLMTNTALAETPALRSGPSAGPPATSPQHDVAPARRRALYGDLHMHTGWSFDAWGMLGVQTTPFDAYAFARGDAIDYMGHRVRKRRPLDFMAVTDHAEYLSVLNEMDDVASELSQSAFGKVYRNAPMKAFQAIHEAFTQGKPLPPFDYAALMKDAWQRTVEAANRFNEPGRFTALIGYEWTSMPQGKYNLHRNVIFRGDSAPYPFDSSLSQKPEDLWTFMEQLRHDGHEVLAIPHNPNASGGFMFDWVDSMGRPIDRDYATRRQANEPVVEIFQGKGQSETAPALSPNDEFANFEVLETLLTDGEINRPGGSYARDAIGRGLTIQERTGVNPFMFGVIGSTDFHNGLSTSAESEFAGRNFGIDSATGMVDRATAERILDPARRKDPGKQEWQYGESKPMSDIIADPTTVGSGGLAGVWANANTRADVFDALARREVFATSGTRMRIRLFAGWDYDPAVMDEADWLVHAYADGVPMGSTLSSHGETSRSPRFLIWAAKDPEGANLDRLQIIKVWVTDGAYRERIYDVAWSSERQLDPATGNVPPVQSTVDLETATYVNSVGETQFALAWQDPDFDPALAAAYYARAIEIPTPRWTTLLARRFDLPLPDNGRPTLQERAVSSPIWYQPRLPSAEGSIASD